MFFRDLHLGPFWDYLSLYNETTKKTTTTITIERMSSFTSSSSLVKGFFTKEGRRRAYSLLLGNGDDQNLEEKNNIFVGNDDDDDDDDFPFPADFGDAPGGGLEAFAEAFDASTSHLSKTFETLDSALDWTNNPLRFVFATFTVCATITWFGYAGDNVHLHRQAGSLAYCGGLTGEMTWKSGMICGTSGENNNNSGKRDKIGGIVLLLYRLMCLVLCLMYCYYENVSWFLACVGRAPNGLEEYAEYYEWSVLVLTAFFGVATVASVKGVFGHYTKEESVRYVGHSRKTNRLGHWVVMLYSTAFTLALALDAYEWGRMIFLPRCAADDEQGKLETLLDPKARECYLNERYYFAYGINLILLFGEACLGRLTFPKCYLGLPIFACCLYILVVDVMHGYFGMQWPTEAINVMRWQACFNVNAIFFGVFFVHFVLVWTLGKTKRFFAKVLFDDFDERTPLFM